MPTPVRPTSSSRPLRRTPVLPRASPFDFTPQSPADHKAKPFRAPPRARAFASTLGREQPAGQRAGSMLAPKSSPREELSAWREDGADDPFPPPASPRYVPVGDGSESGADTPRDTPREMPRSRPYTANLGAVRTWSEQIGRVEISKAGSRSAASGARPAHWFPTAPPRIDLTRPSTARSVAFRHQITRKQDVNGKLLENIAMTRFLFGTAGGNGQEYYEKAHDTLMKPLHVSSRKRVGRGQHHFKAQLGRLPMHLAGTRAAAEGSFPSHWEPGIGYSESLPRARKVANFSRQLGRVDLHLSGMRGAPARDTVAPIKMPPVGWKAKMHAELQQERPWLFARQEAPREVKEEGSLYERGQRIKFMKEEAEAARRKAAYKKAAAARKAAAESA